MIRFARACVASPVRITVTALVVTPVVHLFLAKMVERRKITWSTEYPAVVIGDPILALCAGIAASAAGMDAVRASAPLRRPLGPTLTGGAMLFGAWQLRDELRRGVYTQSQAFSPSKLWHQFVVYPTMVPLVCGTLLPATAAARSPGAGARVRVSTALAWAGTLTWAVLVAEAVAHPRQGHGSFDWKPRGRNRAEARDGHGR